MHERESGRADSNRRPPAPKAGALTRLRYVPPVECNREVCGLSAAFWRFKSHLAQLQTRSRPEPLLTCRPLVARRVRTGVAVVVTALSLAGAADAASTATLTRSESSLLTAMNEVRLQSGLQPLHADARLERAAERTARACSAPARSPTAPSARASAAPASTRGASARTSRGARAGSAPHARSCGVAREPRAPREPAAPGLPHRRGRRRFAAASPGIRNTLW